MTVLDTNVLIYSCDRSDPARQRIALDLVERTVDGVLLWQVAVEFIAASRKLAAQGFTANDAWNRLDEFLDLLDLVIPERHLLHSARRLHVQQHLSFWDAMIVAACVATGVSRLYSEDIPGGAPPPGLEIVNPFA